MSNFNEPSITKPRRTVNATVKTKAEAEDGWKIELDIPSFASKYPIIVDRVSAHIASSLQSGKAYPLILEQQNLKKGKDGRKDYDYYYGLVGIDDGEAPSPPQPQEQPAPDEPTRSLDRQDLIMLQHASGVVVQAYGNWMQLPRDDNSGPLPINFSDYLKNIAVAATWYLKNVYQQGGYSLAPAPVKESWPPDEEPPF